MNKIVEFKNFYTSWLPGESSPDEMVSDVQRQVLEIINALHESEDDGRINSYFELLSEWQTALAEALFRYDLPLTSWLREVVRNFDRLDDEDSRMYWLDKIKEGKYPLP